MPVHYCMYLNRKASGYVVEHIQRRKEHKIPTVNTFYLVHTHTLSTTYSVQLLANIIIIIIMIQKSA